MFVCAIDLNGAALKVGGHGASRFTHGEPQSEAPCQLRSVVERCNRQRHRRRTLD